MNVEEIRAQFPILNEKVNGKPLVYFDNGATAQKPQSVIDAISSYYGVYNANIHRGVHELSQRATEAFENGRKKIQSFINAKHDHEVIINKGTTDGINLIASCYGKAFIKPGDEIIITAMEHHSNIVPWQLMCEERGAVLKVAPINEKGELIWEDFISLLNDKTRLVSMVHVSNTLGTINPVEKVISECHSKGVHVLLDGAQAVPHMKVDVQALGVDFYVFSAHKMYGPTGVGVLYGKEELLDQLPPYQGGGDMIKTVTFEKTTYNSLPHKFEAGTPNIADGIAMSACIDFMNKVGLDQISQIEKKLLDYATPKMEAMDHIEIIGTADKKAAVISFVSDLAHPFDIGTLLDQQGIAVRTGHHCTEPLMNFFGVPGTARVSFACYNTIEEVDIFLKALERSLKMLA
jgi:cysteine desulfurase/selenocysteine lyase